MKRQESPARAKRRLRLALRDARESVELTQREVAQALDWSVSKVLRIENGHVSVAISDVRALLPLYEILDREKVAGFVELCRQSRGRTPSTEYVDVLGKGLAEWLEHESSAASVFWYETKLIPGVLQTPDYAASIIRAYLGSDADDADVQRRASARIARTETLLTPDGPAMSFILDEATLRRAVGRDKDPYRVMIAQLEYLKSLNTSPGTDATQNPRVSIQIVPFEFGEYPMMRGPFELLEFDDEARMTYLEGPKGDQIITEASEDTAQYLESFLKLQGQLPGPDRTNSQLDDVINLMKSGSNGITTASRSRRRAST